MGRASSRAAAGGRSVTRWVERLLVLRQVDVFCTVLSGLVHNTKYPLLLIEKSNHEVATSGFRTKPVRSS